jgi:hypothetical protein
MPAGAGEANRDRYDLMELTRAADPGNAREAGPIVRCNLRLVPTGTASRRKRLTVAIGSELLDRGRVGPR